MTDNGKVSKGEGMGNDTQALTLKEKLGYGLGDTASNIVFQVIVNFMMIFYTDVFGISAAAVGTLMLAVRLFDAVTDPVMGGLADRTRSRWGRYRPWLLFAAVPYGVLAVLAFTTPDLSANGKLVYAYVTYAALMTVYTIINIPYSALGGVLTSDPRERASVQSYRFAMAMVGGAIVTALTMPLVHYFAGGLDGDLAFGYQMTLGVLSAVAVVCFMVCFWTTRERLVEAPAPAKKSIFADLVELLGNRQWLLIAGVAFFLLVLVAVRSAVTPYYVKYFLGREDLVSPFITAGMLAAVAGALLTNLLTRYLCKVRLFQLANIGVIVFHLVLYLVPGEQLVLAFTAFMLANFFQMIVVPLMFSMVPDTVDYGAQQSGNKNMAMAFSAHLLVIKLGLAVGGALTGWLLAFYGYEANQSQSARAMGGIVVLVALMPAVCALANGIIMKFYRLTSAEMRAIHARSVEAPAGVLCEADQQQAQNRKPPHTDSANAL
ncbi:glycoside-pentoside-hexuronide (GPH):cation symporter [Microbulbifer sp. ALW1]|uniref:glycoside-pentoside-hexuronide (GPH):cation symporter n=1 Tax=Microbulbifer sp. (strain ALW1) TaxID=1516059 RepID=UPI001912656F|nr:MFS transporter [Microbulbifer sp. ALW1]